MARASRGAIRGRVARARDPRQSVFPTASTDVRSLASRPPPPSSRVATRSSGRSTPRRAFAVLPKRHPNPKRPTSKERGLPPVRTRAHRRLSNGEHGRRPLRGPDARAWARPRARRGELRAPGRPGRPRPGGRNGDLERAPIVPRRVLPPHLRLSHRAQPVADPSGPAARSGRGAHRGRGPGPFARIQRRGATGRGASLRRNPQLDGAAAPGAHAGARGPGPTPRSQPVSTSA